MNLTHTLLSLALLLPSTALAQTQLVRGKVEDIAGTNRFVLDCTMLELTSTTLNLNALVGQQFDLQVTKLPASLNVVSATPVAKIFDMGNLRIGRADRWQITGLPGEQAFAFLTSTDLTSYMPAGIYGTWLLGSTFAPIASGTIGQLGRFEFSFQPPNVPFLIGVSFTAQGGIVGATRALFTNPDCKTLEAN
jgi:hypothetical protein